MLSAQPVGTDRFVSIAAYNMAATLSQVNDSLLEHPKTWPSDVQAPEMHSTLLSPLMGWSSWQYIVTILLGIVLYDQGEHYVNAHSIDFDLTVCLVMYIKRKGSIAGPMFKIPLMGPFIQALHPKFDAYLAQWASGPLSCVSVFHKYVFLTHDSRFPLVVDESIDTDMPRLDSLSSPPTAI